MLFGKGKWQGVGSTLPELGRRARFVEPGEQQRRSEKTILPRGGWRGVKVIIVIGHWDLRRRVATQPLSSVYNCNVTKVTLALRFEKGVSISKKKRAWKQEKKNRFSVAQFWIRYPVMSHKLAEMRNQTTCFIWEILQCYSFVKS